MHHFLLLLALSTTPQAALPAEVEAFVAEREACDHFRGEPVEGDSPAQVERRAFVQDSLEIHCAGTDRRLAALRRRHAGNAAVLSALAGYEATIEADIEAPGCGGAPASSPGSCPVPGELVQWQADYCLFETGTDDVIAAGPCIDRESKLRFPDTCTGKSHYKRALCELVIGAGLRAGPVESCMRDPLFSGTTVRDGGA